MSHLKVVTLIESNFRDPAATLRAIADEIDAGHYGEVSSAVLVLAANELSVIPMGRESDSGVACLLLNAAVNKLVAPLLGPGT
jgi:hypothetical protein